MSLAANLIPVMIIMLIAACVLRFIISSTLISFLLLAFMVYLLPPLLWRLSRILVPVEHGISSLEEDAELFNGWVISHELQKIYNSFPALEIFLKCIPGFYSAWLRLWGAEIGSEVQWSLGGKVIDRPFIQIGDRCIIGQNAQLKAHTMNVKNQKIFLQLKIIKIGNDEILLRPINL